MKSLLALAALASLPKEPAEAPAPAAEPVEEVPPGCLAGPRWEDLTTDAGMIASQGLSRAQVVDGMDSAYGSLRRCVPDDRSLHTALTADLTVTCDGRVDRVALSGTLDPAVADCMQRALSEARFPAHALPDGFEFSYVMELDFTAGR